MSSEEVIRSAIKAALELDKEAGNGEDSGLSALLQAIATESGKTYFADFCVEITASIRTCFSRLKTLRPLFRKGASTHTVS